MRTIHIKLDRGRAINSDVTVVKLDNFSLFDDLSAVSGTCNPNITIASEGKCLVSTDSGITYQSAYCKTQNVKRMGYITVSGEQFPVEDGSVLIGDSLYEAVFVKNNEGSKFEDAYVIIDDIKYSISDCQQSNWKTVQKVVVRNTTPDVFSVVDCQCFEDADCIELNGQQYDIQVSGSIPFVTFEDEVIYPEPYEEDGVQMYYHEDGERPELVFNREDLGITGSYSVMSYEKKSAIGNKFRLYVDKASYDMSHFNEDDVIRIHSMNDSDDEFAVQHTESGTAYVDYYNNMYPVSADMRITVFINDEWHDVTYSGDVTPDMWVGYLTNYPEVYISAFTSNGQVSEIYKRTLVSEGNDKYFSNEPIDFRSYSGISLDGMKYYVENDISGYDDDGEPVVKEIVKLPSRFNGLFKVKHVSYDAGMLDLMYLSLNSDDYTDIEEDDLVRYTLGKIAGNWSNYIYHHQRNLFGYHLENVGDYYTYDKDNLQDNFLIKAISDSVSVSVPLSNAYSINLNNEWNIEDLLGERLLNAVNNNTDVERDIYSPVWHKVTTDEDGNESIENILLKKLKFQLHFRTRNLADWSVNEDSVELSNDGISSWNCLDHYCNDYTEDHTTHEVIYNNDKRKQVCDNIANCADLLYFLNFTEKDVFYQKSALAKSFIRLSFFDSPYPNEQSLLWTSTVFFDEGKCYSKYLDNIENQSFKSFDRLSNTDYNFVSVKGEPYVNGSMSLDNDNRLCMEFEVENKITSRVSSEGYYIYIYKEYAQYLHERKIYMRVDFNHAKVGQVVPMMFLKHYDEEEQAYTMYQANCSNDVFKARDGVPMRQMINYLYTPITLVYDENLGRYTYHFDELVPEEGEELSINLFEAKFKDESK